MEDDSAFIPMLTKETDSYEPTARDIWDGASPKSVAAPPLPPARRRHRPKASAKSVPSVSSSSLLTLAPVQIPEELCYPSNSDDNMLVLTKDEEVSWHSAQMLSYASPVLSQYMQYQEGIYTLSVNAPLTEWLVLAQFLEPHSRRAVRVTPVNLPQVLPWFRDLRLEVLVQECDAILASMPSIHVQDNLLLLEICQLCLDELGATALPKTWALSLYRFEHELMSKNPPRQLEHLQSLTSLLRNDKARKKLWPAVSQYLPDDLPISGVEGSLVQNHLFPYLLRQGILASLPPETPTSIFASTSLDQHEDDVCSIALLEELEEDVPVNFSEWFSEACPVPKQKHRSENMNHDKTAWLKRIRDRLGATQAPPPPPIHRTFSC